MNPMEKIKKRQVESSQRALQLVQELFDKAEEDGNLTLLGVWNIVTALRGPDEDPTSAENLDRLESLKEKYTTPIRAMVLTLSQAQQVGVSFQGEFELERSKKLNIRETSSQILMDDAGPVHFLAHIEFAVKVIRRALESEGE